MTATEKTALRQAFLAKRAAISPADMVRSVLSMVEALLALPPYRTAGVICGYASVRGEPDLDPLWRAAAAAGKRYALPAIGAMAGEMTFRALPGYCPARLALGRFGIPEPPAAAAFPSLELCDLSNAIVVVPGLSFDRAGYRLGYGGGYYDRLLAATAESGVPLFSVAFCPSCLLADTLPREAHDRAVDCIITERSVTFTYARACHSPTHGGGESSPY